MNRGSNNNNSGTTAAAAAVVAATTTTLLSHCRRAVINKGIEILIILVPPH